MRLQAFIDGIEPQVRRRLRGKLQTIRHVYDIDDVMASTRRRVDRALIEGHLVLGSADETAAYVQRTAERLVLETLRWERRHRQRVETVARQAPSRRAASRRAPEDAEVVRRALDHLDEDERTVLELRAADIPHRGVAKALDISLEASRSRWRRSAERLRQLLRHPPSTVPRR